MATSNTPPAKKAAPSLSDIKKDDSKKEESNTKENTTTESNTPVVENKKTDDPNVVKETPDGEHSNTDASHPVEEEAHGEINALNLEHVQKAEPPVDNTDKSTVNKTPAALAAETPDQVAERFGLDQQITVTDDKNPNVNAFRVDETYEIPSGTHLHPDVKSDVLNRNPRRASEDASVRVTSHNVHVYAKEAQQDDKGITGNNVNTPDYNR